MYFNRMAKYYETQSSGRYSVQGEVTDWVKVPFNEALYGRNYCGSIVCPTSRSLVRDALAVWVKNRLDAGQDDGPDPELPPLVRRVGPVRPGRRRELRRAGRLHRPLPDRPRRRRRGRGRPGLRHGRDLEPPLLREPPGRRPGRHHRREHRHERRPRHQPARPEQRDGRLGGRLHDAAGERRPRRLRPRVRARPRPAGPLRHVGEHRRRRELDRLLDAHVLGREHRRRRPRRDRRQPDRPRRLGEAPARLARLRTSPRRASPPRTGSAPRRARPGTASRASSSSCRPSRWPPRSSLPRRAAGRTGAAWATTSTTR